MPYPEWTRDAVQVWTGLAGLAGLVGGKKAGDGAQVGGHSPLVAFSFVCHLT